MFKRLLIINLFLLSLICIPSFSFAHQPRIVDTDLVEVNDPEISKVYYATLSGVPNLYFINSDADFDLYVDILLPDIVTKDKSTVVEISRIVGVSEDWVLLKTIGGKDAKWEKFFEPFGQSTYFSGGEYKVRAEAGIYVLKVSSEKNNNKYALAIGEKEVFGRREIFNSLSNIPNIKRFFFEESPISFIKSPLGLGYIALMYLIAGIFGFIYRAILSKFLKNSAHGLTKNIGKKDRAFRLFISAGLLFWAITTSWSPVILFFSGFVFFEAIFSWCAFYSLIGKNTCPLN